MKDCPTLKEEREMEQIQQMFNLDEDQTSLKMLTTDMHDTLHKIFFGECNNSAGTFKLIEGKNDPTTFLPLNENIGGQIRSDKHESKENKYLTGRPG